MDVKTQKNYTSIVRKLVSQALLGHEESVEEIQDFIAQGLSKNKFSNFNPEKPLNEIKRMVKKRENYIFSVSDNGLKGNKFRKKKNIYIKFRIKI